MTHPRKPSWRALHATIRSWLIARFLINTPRDKDIWLACIGIAINLESMAVTVLWVEDGRPQPSDKYEERMTLGQAKDKLRQRRLIDDTTPSTLEAVNTLRISLAHRWARWGVTRSKTPQGRAVAHYRGRHIFTDRGGLEELLRDADAAADALMKRLKERAPDLFAAGAKGTATLG